MPTTAWICPACTRRIPGQVGVCRCGQPRVAAGGFEAASGEAPSRAGIAALAGAALVLVLIGAVIAVLARRTPAAAATSGPPVPPLPATVETAADAPAPNAVAVARWPDDPTLWKETAAPLPVRRAAEIAPNARSTEDVLGSALAAVALVETPGGRGTGFFVAPDTLVTNAHVVEAHAYVTVKLATGEPLTGRVVQRSEALDLAAVRIGDARSTQSTLPLASSREARIGQEVFAIGSPLGLQNTVTRGIVSALRQAGSVVLVQTDAAINPGNSGGPILDRGGRVLAVATMRLAGRAEALGFGVAAEHVRALLEGRPVAAGAVAGPAAAFAPGSSEGMDGDREGAEAGYERFLADAARRADQLDRSWTDFVADCLAGKAPMTRSDRGWYALWERFDDAKVSPSCARFSADFKMASREFERRMTEAADEARRMGVYPGVCRQLRQRHRLDSPDW